MNTLIIGYGVVGKNMHKIFTDAFIHDPDQGHTVAKETFFDVAFICVPTEMNKDGSANITIVEEVVEEHKDHVGVFCCKSTVPPGTTDSLDADIVFSPEYFGSTIHANCCEYDFVILGGKKFAASVVAQVYKKIMHPEFKIIFTDAKTAELNKYMENCWLATKVSFCNEFYRIAKKINVDYDELRELWLMDPRINKSHTFVYFDKPYWDSHCLNKDVPAYINYAESVGVKPMVMKAVIDINKQHKND